MAYETAISADGTSIAYETFGQGPPLITVCGATCDRALMRPTAQALGGEFTAVTYDRRGRGDSGDTLPYAIEREIEDIAALIDAVGGSAHLYGHSSGAGLALNAVAAGLPVDRFVLHDPPYSPDDRTQQDAARSYGRHIRDLLADDKRAEALETFFRLTGMPDEIVEAMPASPTWPGLVALAPTLAYDSAVMGDIEKGGAVPAELAARATQPALVLAGGDSPPFMMDVARRLAELLPDGAHRVVEGQGHVVAPEVLAPIVADFLRPSGAISAGGAAIQEERTAMPPVGLQPGSLGAAHAIAKLPAQDLERARAFYRDQLGLEPVEERDGGLRYCCAAGEFHVFLSSGAASGTSTQLGFEVADIDATVAELRARGVTFDEVAAPGFDMTDGIVDVDGHYPSKGTGERGAWFRDSEGNVLAVGQATG